LSTTALRQIVQVIILAFNTGSLSECSKVEISEDSPSGGIVGKRRITELVGDVCIILWGVTLAIKLGGEKRHIYIYLKY
jgi:hypothetical protein